MCSILTSWPREVSLYKSHGKCKSDSCLLQRWCPALDHLLHCLGVLWCCGGIYHVIVLTSLVCYSPTHWVLSHMSLLWKVLSYLTLGPAVSLEGHCSWFPWIGTRFCNLTPGDLVCGSSLWCWFFEDCFSDCWSIHSNNLNIVYCVNIKKADNFLTQKEIYWKNVTKISINGYKHFIYSKGLLCPCMICDAISIKFQCCLTQSQ